MLAREQEQLGLAHAAEIKGKEQPCRAGGEEGLELPVGDRRLENKDRQIIVDPLRPGEQQREARGRERAAALQIGQQIVHVRLRQIGREGNRRRKFDCFRGCFLELRVWYHTEFFGCSASCQ